MFADHGVVHVRDVATSLVHLTEQLNGLFLPVRSPERVTLMQTMGVAMAYIHDVGMVDMTHIGRATHAVYAAHIAFTSDVDPLVDHLLSPGPLRERLDAVDRSDPFAVPIRTVVQEVLSLAVAHSKSKVPAHVLADPSALQQRMRDIVSTSMAEHRIAAGGGAESDHGVRAERAWGTHPCAADAYSWLTADTGPKGEFADDVIDTVRVLRAADVLRQRGSALRTSGGFEVFRLADRSRGVHLASGRRALCLPRHL